MDEIEEAAFMEFHKTRVHQWESYKYKVTTESSLWRWERLDKAEKDEFIAKARDHATNTKTSVVEECSDSDDEEVDELRLLRERYGWGVRDKHVDGDIEEEDEYETAWADIRLEEDWRRHYKNKRPLEDDLYPFTKKVAK